jgi:hypothetical protein
MTNRQFAALGVRLNHGQLSKELTTEICRGRLPSPRRTTGRTRSGSGPPTAGIPNVSCDLMKGPLRRSRSGCSISTHVLISKGPWPAIGSRSGGQPQAGPARPRTGLSLPEVAIADDNQGRSVDRLLLGAEAQLAQVHVRERGARAAPPRRTRRPTAGWCQSTASSHEPLNQPHRRSESRSMARMHDILRYDEMERRTPRLRCVVPIQMRGRGLTGTGLPIPGAALERVRPETAFNWCFSTSAVVG